MINSAMNAIKITTAHQQSPLIKVIISFIVVHKIKPTTEKNNKSPIVIFAPDVLTPDA